MFFRWLFLIIFYTFLSWRVGADNFDPDYHKNLIQAWWMRPTQQFSDISNRLILLTRNKGCREKLINGTRKIYLFTYFSHNLRLKGYVSFVPNKKARAPVLFLLRGGNRFYGLMNPANRYSCYGPYTVIGLSYRGSVSDGVDQYGGDDVADAKNLLDYFPVIAKRYGIATTSNRYLLGTSRGGMQMFLLLNRYPYIESQFRSVMSLSGVLDLFSWIKERPEMAEMFRDEFFMTKKNQYHWLTLRNPLTNIHNIPRDLPIIIVQGSKDERVHVSQGKTMVKALLHQGFRSIDYREIGNAYHVFHNLDDDLPIIWQIFGEEN